MKRTLIALACVLGLSLALAGTADASTLGDILKRIQQVAAAPVAAPVPAPAPAAPPVTGNSPFDGQIEAPAGVIGGTGHGCCPGTSGSLGRLIFANQKGQLSCSIPFNSDIAFGHGAGVALVTFKGGDNVYGCHNDDATQVTMLNVGPPPLATGTPFNLIVEVCDDSLCLRGSETYLTVSKRGDYRVPDLGSERGETPGLGIAPGNHVKGKVSAVKLTTCC